MLASLLKEYEREKRPIRVSFRELLGDVSYGDRLNHFVHPYAAKLLPHIPLLFLRSGDLSAPFDSIFDPFCGSGTVPLESILANRNAMYCDANPLARLITKVKTTPISDRHVDSALLELKQRIPSRPRGKPPSVVNLDYWFGGHVTRSLQRLSEALSLVESQPGGGFLRLCFSVCVRKSSFCDPRLSVPVRLRKDQYPVGHPLRRKCREILRALETLDVFELFYSIVETNRRRMIEFTTALNPGGKAVCIGDDARTVSPASAVAETRGTIEPRARMVITSPPYMGAQKYIRASSLSIGWLGLASAHELRGLEKLSIGREHFRKSEWSDIEQTGIPEADAQIVEASRTNPVRARIAAQYLVDMRKAFVSVRNLLIKNGTLVLVVGDNQLCGKVFRTSRYLEHLLRQLRFDKRLELVDGIRSRGLMTKRNQTAGVIAEERVLMFDRC